MKILFLILLAVISGLALAHSGFRPMPKNFEFQTDTQPRVTVNIDEGNTVHVYIGENMEYMGSRTTFCESLD